METTEAPVTHRLRNYYRFWRSMESTDGTSYADSLEDLGLCRTVEDFWRIYLSLPKIGTGKATHYYLFKNKIEPTWEHERNRKGGRITVSIYKKELAPYMWELLLLTTIGEQFDVGSEICGVSVSVKRWNCVFSVWNHTATFEQAINKIE
ncbi:eukaryotic translation initiation factor 4e type [Blastocystis sp. subtype 4]|uniref:eukaryotic translation initiation factor 4e type n=1 Tax=Blastocystis sp. subtype 4 TaxID=944170 RepID=UPI0007121183|nr:eukaryotic translation initiation factor 4e type [Blastocystis sp. subtype 4]KNB42679.1 eukaryotic translation initiation factor 4e type [Blastocystis sp. subtype 4]|eukprot:XP_014526122.1 eukaryotic translation initiation factor 4e type [Blastocystis sp. subtype 4]